IIAAMAAFSASAIATSNNSSSWRIGWSKSTRTFSGKVETGFAGHALALVMPALVAGIHVLILKAEAKQRRGWPTSPAMMMRRVSTLPLPCRLEGFALGRIVEARIIVIERSRRLDVERGEDRPLLFEHVRDLLLEHAKVGKLVSCGVAGRARNTGKIHLFVWNRMAAVRLVRFVMRDEMNEILGCGRGDRHQTPKIHQKAAVALQDDDAFIRPAKRKAKPVRGIQPHGPDRQIIEHPRIDRDPVDCRAVGRDHRLVGDVARQDTKAFVPLYHGALGLRPIRNTTGSDSA